jgi:Protein of unknown function (DUF1761)
MNEILSNLNIWAIVVASVVNFGIGAIWFGPKTFYPMWIKLMGREMPTETIPMKASDTILMFGGTFVAQVVQVFTLAVIFELVNLAGVVPTIGDGALIGFLFALGLGAFGSLSHRMFAQADYKTLNSIKVWLIEVSQDVVALTAAGLILAAWV